MSSISAGPSRSIVSMLRSTYGPKAALDLNDALVSRYVYRPISFYLAVPFVWAGLSPNQVSFIGLSIALIGMTLLATGRPTAAIVGSVLCALQVIIDYVDGNIARLRATTSHLGKFVDGVVDTVIGTLLPLAVGIGLSRQPDGTLTRLWGENAPTAALLLGSITAIGTCLRAMLVFRLKAARLDAAAVRPGNPGQAPSHAAETRSRAQRLANRIDKALRNEMFTMLSAIVMFAWMRMLGLFLIIRCASTLLGLGIELLRTVVLARRDLGVARPV